MLKEETNHNFEAGFLIARENKTCPLEIKASGYKRHASLDAFCAKYDGRVLRKYLAYTKDYIKDANVTCLPVYMIPFV